MAQQRKLWWVARDNRRNVNRPSPTRGSPDKRGSTCSVMSVIGNSVAIPMASWPTGQFPSAP
jgi:hypothetical protein